MTKQIAVYKRAEQRSAMFRLMLSLIVVQLANDDAVGASVRYQDFLQCGPGAGRAARPAGALTPPGARPERARTREPGFMNADEGKAAHTLLEAFESGEQARLTPIITKAPFIYLDNEIARTARQLKVAQAGAAGDDLR